MKDIVRNYSTIFSTWLEVPDTDLDPKCRYFVAVQFVDGGGYSSALTPAIMLGNPLQKGKVVIRLTDLAGVIVIVGFVILILGAGFGIYFVKHRQQKKSIAGVKFPVRDRP